MRVIMTGGGTGGHIYPAIAIADEIKRRYPDAEILFVGAERGLEKTLVPKRGYNIRLITVEGFDRKNLIRNVSVVRKLMKGSAQARKIIRDFRPDFVVGTGGYASAPMVKAANVRGIFRPSPVICVIYSLPVLRITAPAQKNRVILMTP